MRTVSVRTAVIATVAAVAGLAGTPALAAEPATGLTFYRDSFATPVLHLPEPDGTCTALPATADSLIGWSGVTQVVAYRGAGCTGIAASLGTLRTFTAGTYVSFRAS